MKFSVFALLLLSCVVRAQTVPDITPTDVQQRIRILASDSLDGRMSGSVGGEKAANYIASEFKRLGLTAIDSLHDYKQQFNFREMMRDTTQSPRLYTANVVGLLRGNDKRLSNEYLVVGAHYDHLGHGGMNALDRGDTNIHYGADDNASGTAGVLELAEYFAAHKNELKRSIVFIAFSGEEEGLFGSTYFVRNPLVPLKKIVGMINMDMIGRMKDSVLIVEGMGSSPDWSRIVSKAHLAISQVSLRQKQEAIGPSDHSSFYLKELPVLFFWTGNHADYHKHSDTWDKINTQGEAWTLSMVTEVIKNLTSRPKRIAYTKAPVDTTKKTAGFGVYVGGVPDYTYEGKGVKVSSVTENSPAFAGGMKAEDVIVGFGDVVINNIYDYTGALSKHKPDEVIEVKVQRGSDIVPLSVKLGRRSEAH